jgi:putative FmdB family regulatory protein
MPTYDFCCAKCSHSFESYRSISDRDAPCSLPCPSCGQKSIQRSYESAPAAAVDMTLGPGADFKEVMEKVKRGIPKRYRENLDQAASRRGTVWGTG